MDERQGRIGTVTALARRGTRPAGLVPPPPGLPRLRTTRTLATLSAADKTALTARARAVHADMFKAQCEAFREPIEDRAWTLDDHHILILIPCSVGKYVPDQRLFLAFLAEPGSDGAITPLSLPYPLGNHDGKIVPLPGAEYSPETGTLYLFAKQGVRADCGSSGEWLWMDGAFRLSAFMQQGVCGGSAPQDWLTVYRSRRF